MSVDLNSWILTFLIFWPILCAAALVLVPSRYDREIKAIAAVSTFVSMVASIWLYWCAYDPGTPGVQMGYDAPWITAFNVHYKVGVDGLSISLVLLTGLISFIACIASFGIQKMVKGYFILYLILQTGMVGTFCALDFFLFFVFWELMLLPMYFLIGIWGGPRKEYAAIKFFLFTMGGSVFLLLGMLAIYFHSETVLPARTFDLTALATVGHDFANWHLAKYVWWGMFVAFIVKVPSAPLHTWLPDAHVEAPTPISVILAGILLKMGGYGILRICMPILPDASREFANWIGLLGVVSIVYGAFCAMAQTDFKKLVAYASVSSMGYVVLGIGASAAGGGPAGVNGAILQMFAHGIYSPMLFLVVGVIYDRVHVRDLDVFGGLAQKMPLYAGLSGLAFMTALGLPGLAVFVSEAMVLIGSWNASGPFRTYAVVAATAVIITAAYMLWTMQRVFLGPPKHHYHHTPADELADLSGREQVTLVPLAIIAILLGFYPTPVLHWIEAGVSSLLGSFPTTVAGLMP